MCRPPAVSCGCLLAPDKEIGSQVWFLALEWFGVSSNLLREDHGLAFNRLLTIANVPTGRFGLLLRSFNPRTVPFFLCRTLINVGHNGCLYDCDFNRALAIS